MEKDIGSEKEGEMKRLTIEQDDEMFDRYHGFLMPIEEIRPIRDNTPYAKIPSVLFGLGVGGITGGIFVAVFPIPFPWRVIPFFVGIVSLSLQAIFFDDSKFGEVRDRWKKHKVDAEDNSRGGIDEG